MPKAPIFEIEQVEQRLKEWSLQGFRYDLAMIFEVKPPPDVIVLLHRLGENVKVCRIKSLDRAKCDALLQILRTYCFKVNIIGSLTFDCDQPTPSSRAITFTD